MKQKALFASILMLAVASQANAGVLKFSAKHVVKPTAKASAKAVKHAAKFTKKVVF